MALNHFKFWIFCVSLVPQSLKWIHWNKRVMMRSNHPQQSTINNNHVLQMSQVVCNLILLIPPQLMIIITALLPLRPNKEMEVARRTLTSTLNPPWCHRDPTLPGATWKGRRAPASRRSVKKFRSWCSRRRRPQIVWIPLLIVTSVVMKALIWIQLKYLFRLPHHQQMMNISSKYWYDDFVMINLDILISNANEWLFTKHCHKTFKILHIVAYYAELQKEAYEIEYISCYTDCIVFRSHSNQYHVS